MAPIGEWTAPRISGKRLMQSLSRCVYESPGRVAAVALLQCNVIPGGAPVRPDASTANNSRRATRTTSSTPNRHLGLEHPTKPFAMANGTVPLLLFRRAAQLFGRTQGVVERSAGVRELQRGVRQHGLLGARKPRGREVEGASRAVLVQASARSRFILACIRAVLTLPLLSPAAPPCMVYISSLLAIRLKGASLPGWCSLRC